MATETKLPGNVLTFLPRKMDRFFGEVAEQTFAGRRTYFCTRAGVGGMNIQPDLARRFRTSDASERHGLSESDYEQIILRDRVLRTMDVEQARRLINAMADLVEDLFDRSQPQYVFSLIVDHYMLDLVARTARRRGAHVCMSCSGVARNTILVTAYGEFNFVRDPSEEEVDRTLNELCDARAQVTYAHPPQPYTRRRHLRDAAWWWANYAAFSFMARCSRDVLNYRYLCATNPAIYPESSWAGYRCTHYFDHDWLDRLNEGTRPRLFFPLGFTPEATTDYWLGDLRYVDYENFVLDAAAQLSRDFLVIVKEHWAAAGKRPWDFYRRLSEIPSVVLPPPDVKSRQIMQRVDGVLVGAGTAGVEAALQGLKVATLDRPYYHVDGVYLNLHSADRIGDLSHLMAEFPQGSCDRDRQRLIVRRMLEPTLPGSHLPPELNTSENCAVASAGLRTYLHRISAATRRDASVREGRTAA